MNRTYIGALLFIGCVLLGALTLFLFVNAGNL